MTSWYSWLPGLPSLNLALPSSLQGRFLSFILKKSLGHLLRPGQLDTRQIDSQIGSGYVQVNDVELDNEAINNLLPGLPIALHDGFMSSITTRIPWPNPLTSTIGFSLNNLRLTFHLLPQSTGSDLNLPDASLAESVFSVAESFIHEELIPQEEHPPWESNHLDLTASLHPNSDPNIPGSLDADPFSSIPEESFYPDSDPAGVSLFTTLIERLLARFEFDAVNTEITLVHPGNMSVTLSIADIRYQTEGSNGERHREIGTLEEVRTLSVSGVRITAQNLKDVSVPSSSSTRAASPSSSTSSLDEETQFTMSQSLAYLPPRPVSPTVSDTSSMYQSAISASHALGDNLDHPLTSNENHLPYSPPVIPPKGQPITDEHYSPLYVPVSEEILTFGVLPILAKLTTSSAADGEMKGSSSLVSTQRTGQGVNLSITCGVVACALRGWHIVGLTELATKWMSHPSPRRATQTTPDPPQSIAEPGVTVTLSIRGLVLLVVIPATSAGAVPALVLNRSLMDFYKRPLIPPTLPQGYLRVHLDNISGSVSPSENIRSHSMPTGRAHSGSTKAISTALLVRDLSVFSYNIPSSTNHHPSSYISPIIITDHVLLSQYPNIHIHPYQTGSSEIYTPLPKFDILDWTDPKYHDAGVKLSTWRSAPPAKSNKGQMPLGEEISYSPSPPSIQYSARLDGRPMQSSVPAISINMDKPSLSPRHRQMVPPDEIMIKIAPLNTFFDLKLLLDRGGILALIDEISDGIKSISNVEVEWSEGQSRCSEGTEALFTRTPSNPGARERYIPEPLVFDDFDQGRQDNARTTSKTKNFTTPSHGPTMSLYLDLLRVQIRAPPFPECPARSGALCIDLHNLKLTTEPVTSKLSAHFDLPLQAPPTSGGNTTVNIELSRILIAATAVHERTAVSIISIGSLGLPSYNPGVQSEPALASHVPLKPRMTINNPSSVNIDLPSVHVDMNKSIYNAIQYLIDDVTQLVDRTFGDDTSTEKIKHEDASLIGSRYFAKSRNGSGIRVTHVEPHKKSGASIKLSLSEAFIRITVPGAKPEPSARLFMIVVSDMDTLIELKPQGRDETALTISVMDISVRSTTPLGGSETFLSLTTPRSLSLPPRSMIQCCFTSLTVPETAAKESRIRVTLSGFTFTMIPDLSWVSDLTAFVKSPPGTFESVIPSERTSISLKVVNGSILTLAPRHTGALVIYVGDSEFSTDVIGDSSDSSFQLHVSSLAFLFIDDISDQEIRREPQNVGHGVAFWKGSGFALLGEVSALAMDTKHNHILSPAHTYVKIDRVGLRIHLCADSLAALTTFAADLASLFTVPTDNPSPSRLKRPTMVSKEPATNYSIMNSIEDLAFHKMPEIGPAPDMINDDLPTNMDYLDESFGAAAGLRELRDEDLDEFDNEDGGGLPPVPATSGNTGIVSRVGGETIKIFRPEGIHVSEGYFDNLPPDTDSTDTGVGEKILCLRVFDADVTLLLYEGYDWVRTRKVIEEEVKEMRRRLAKIRQLVANGQVQEPITEDTSSLLFNSLYIGLDQDINEMEPGALLAAIDNELKDDVDIASQSSWQTLKPPVIGKSRQSTRVHGKRLTRSKSPSMEFCLSGLRAEVDQYRPNEPMVSRTFITVHNVEILDHIKTSTWKKFLTELRSDSHGNIRETDSNMIRVELCTVRPVPGHPSEEARLRAKILPLRLYVDQDAVDFLKKFFSFKDPHAISVPDTQGVDDDIYFQLAEVFPVDLKLDYKPRRVDYRALREGKTIELMNFFHFDGAEMTLRHITLAGITGWPRFFDLLNDLWTPDVKATQLVEVISGVAPIRSVVNVGSGIADLVLLPIAQYKKDGRIVRGVQKGTTAFVKSTAIEAIRLGARLATGTQVILEQAEGVLGGSRSITAEAVQSATLADVLNQHQLDGSDDEDAADAISKYAQQPADIKEGMQSAYKSLQRNFNSAAQTILAVPMEVYERSGNEGPVRSVIRAVPIAVLRPMIGASEAVSQTLLGLHNTLDPNIRHDNEAKYKSH